MARKRFTAEQIIIKSREAEVVLACTSSKHFGPPASLPPIASSIAARGIQSVQGFFSVSGSSATSQPPSASAIRSQFIEQLLHWMWLPASVPRPDASSRPQETPCSTGHTGSMDPLTPAKSCDTLFASQPFQHHPHLLFRRVLLSRLPTDLPHLFFSRHLLFHSEPPIRKVSLSFSAKSVRNGLTGYTIAIEDVIAYLIATFEFPGAASRVFWIDGWDQAAYGDILTEYAR